jgi:hypothetical protein
MVRHVVRRRLAPASLNSLHNATTNERKMKTKTTQNLFASFLACLVAVTAVHASSPSIGDVGDADSFGKNAHFLGAASGFLTLSPSCTPGPSPVASPSPSPANTDQCFTLNPPPAATVYSAPNICRINLPKSAAADVIYPVLTFFVNYQLQNPTAVQVPNGRFEYSATLTIFSAVLNDPSIIDPNTGLPAGGALTFVFSPDRFDINRSLEANERDHQRLDYTRAGNAGIAKSALVSAGTLTQHQADDLFKQPMTVRMDVTGVAQYVTDAAVTFNMRLFGD